MADEPDTVLKAQYVMGELRIPAAMVTCPHPSCKGRGPSPMDDYRCVVALSEGKTVRVDCKRCGSRLELVERKIAEGANRRERMALQKAIDKGTLHQTPRK